MTAQDFLCKAENQPRRHKIHKDSFCVSCAFCGSVLIAFSLRSPPGAIMSLHVGGLSKRSASWRVWV